MGLRHPVALADLVAVACTRWRTEEDFHAAKDLAGLDHGQATCWNSRMRWTLTSLIATAVLALTRQAGQSIPECPSAPASSCGFCGPRSCPSPAATWATSCTGPPGDAATSTEPLSATGGATTSPPQRHPDRPKITNYSCRVRRPIQRRRTPRSLAR